MRKSTVIKKLLSMLLITVFSAVSGIPTFGADFTISLASSVSDTAPDAAAYVVFGKNMINNKAQANITSDPTKINWNEIVEYEGRECVKTQIKRNDTQTANEGITKIPINVDDDYIGPNDRNIAISVTFFDHNWDTIHVTYKDSAGKNIAHDIVKYASNEWRTATIILRDPMLSNGLDFGSDFTIDAAESQLLWQDEYISKVQITNLDKSYTDPYAASKADILHTTEARVLTDLGLFDGFVDNGIKYGLDKPLTLEEGVKTVVRLAYGGSNELKNASCEAYDVSEDAKLYVGLALEKGIIKANSDGSIGAGQIITMKALLDMFLRTVKNTGYSVIGNTTAEALEKGVSILLKGADGHGGSNYSVYWAVPGLWSIELGNLDRYAYLDDLAAVSYNMMLLTVSGSEKPVMATLYERGVFKDEDITTSGCGQLIYQFYRQTGIRLEEEIHTDPSTGVTYSFLNLPGLPSTGAYASSQNISSDNRYVILTTAYNHSSKYGILVAYDRETKKTIPLHPDLKETTQYNFMLAVDTDEVFYHSDRDIYRFDLKTMTNHFVGRQDTDCEQWTEVASVTANGDWIASSGYDWEKRIPLSIDVLNTRTGEFETVAPRAQIEKAISAGVAASRGYTLQYIDHIQINPVNENLILHAVHYNESGAPEEIWWYNRETKEHRCVYSDHWDVERKRCDVSSSHYIWSLDGTKIYWVQYQTGRYLSGIGETGIAWTYTEGREDLQPEEWICSDYMYNHVGASGDFKYLVGDTMSIWTGKRFESQLSLNDAETGKSRMLLDNFGIWRAHPGHVHPVMSKDGSLTTFTMTMDNFHLGVGVIDLTKLPEEEPEKFKTAYGIFGEPSNESGVNRFHELTDRLYYSKTQSEIGYIGGKSCVKVTPGYRASFDVEPNYVNAFDHTVTFRVEYFDNGTGSFNVRYNSTNFDQTYVERKYTPYTIKRTGTNQWITKDFTVTDASFVNDTDNAGDFEIQALSSSEPVYIKSIYVSKGDKIHDVSVEADNFDSIKAFADDDASPIKVKGVYTKETAEDGTEYVKLTGNDYVSFKIDDSVEEKKGNNVKIAVTYYDLGLGHISLQYNADKAIEGIPATLNYMPYKISRTGKYVWKTEIIELSNANFKGGQSDGADFRITASNSAVPIYIKQVGLIVE